MIELKGAVLAYGYSSKGVNLQSDFNLTSDLFVDFTDVGQSGELFGHQIVVADFNKDGLDDVIVAAPLWSRFSISPLSNIGRVYYFEQAKTGRKLNGTWITRDDFIPKVCTDMLPL